MDFLKNQISKLQSQRPANKNGQSWVKKGDIEKEQREKYLEEQRKRDEEKKKKEEEKLKEIKEFYVPHLPLTKKQNNVQQVTTNVKGQDKEQQSTSPKKVLLVEG